MLGFVLACISFAVVQSNEGNFTRKHLLIPSYLNRAGFPSSFLDLFSNTALHACYKHLKRSKSVCNVKSRLDPRPFTVGRVPNDAYVFVSLKASIC